MGGVKADPPCKLLDAHKLVGSMVKPPVKIPVRKKVAEFEKVVEHFLSHVGQTLTLHWEVVVYRCF